MNKAIKRLLPSILALGLTLSILLPPFAKSLAAEVRDWKNSYLAYTEVKVYTTYFILEEKGSNLVYSYNDARRAPTTITTSDNPEALSPELNNTTFPIYKRYTDIRTVSEDLLYENDPSVRFDLDTLERILLVGYPNDYYGLVKEYNIAEAQARTATQTVIWELQTKGDLSYYLDESPSDYIIPLYSYRVALVHKVFEPLEIERPVAPELIGDIHFTKANGIWETKELRIDTKGYEPSLALDLPKGVTIWTADGSEELPEVPGNTPFILRSLEASTSLNSLNLEYTHTAFTSFFYEWIPGTGIAESTAPYKNLLRAETLPVARILTLPVSHTAEAPEAPDVPETPEVPESPNNPETPETFDNFSLIVLIPCLLISSLGIILLSFRRRNL